MACAINRHLCCSICGNHLFGVILFLESHFIKNRKSLDTECWADSGTHNTHRDQSDDPLIHAGAVTASHRLTYVCTAQILTPANVVGVR
jgi:hypothetical protein